LRTTAGTSVSNGVSDVSVIEEVNKFGDYVVLEVARVLYLADYLLRAQRYEQAEEILERTLLNDPDGVEVMEQMARIAMFRSDYVKELRFRKMIEEKDPYNYENLLAIAQNLKSQKRLTEAKGYAQQTLRLSSDTTINETAKSILNS
jgi:tetratricopeptide (TPR) repeat protein